MAMRLGKLVGMFVGELVGKVGLLVDILVGMFVGNWVGLFVGAWEATKYIWVRVLLSMLAIHTLPLASMAIPTGFSTPNVINVLPVLLSFVTVSSPVLATHAFPLLSKATYCDSAPALNVPTTPPKMLSLVTVESSELATYLNISNAVKGDAPGCRSNSKCARSTACTT